MRLTTSQSYSGTDATALVGAAQQGHTEIVHRLLDHGAVEQQNFYDYDALRLSQMPLVETRILQTQRHISGIGEPGTPPAAPALANAIFDLTGERHRNLPLNRAVDFRI